MDISSDKLFKVKKIHMKNGDVFEDRMICFVNCFIIVMKTEEDMNPVWYNVDCVKALEEVEDKGAVKKSNGLKISFI